ncbi:aspartyl protease [Thioclava sp. SK-1]|uniref:retropepsin-like aspartic protease family protein n=1 Tax=Thioclava sp. SK-1 TaxID=1889770 RepID=UPI000824DAAD|nr:TIGR02281 family clan AA aspartic protease [Thioclava sp. SK-1]OCX66500.1 aspartyl protease [Thioclava sp. SK-1]
MSGDTFGSLVYLVLLLLAIGGALLFDFRNLGKRLQQLAIWGLIFMGVIAAAGLWDDIKGSLLPQQAVMGDGRIEAPLGPDGHFYLSARVNGVPIRFVVDTGATNIVLSQDDARRAGIDPDALAYVGRANTANGTVRTAPIRLQTLDLGPIHDTQVRATVNGGQMNGSLLGMDYLTRFARVELTRGKLVLER